MLVVVVELLVQIDRWCLYGTRCDNRIKHALIALCGLFQGLMTDSQNGYPSLALAHVAS